MNNRQLTIAGLLACGWREIKPAPSRKYTTFGQPGLVGRMYIGRSGALRWNPKGPIGGSMSLTDSRTHRAYREVGDPAIHWQNTDAAMRAFYRIMAEGRHDTTD